MPTSSLFRLRAEARTSLLADLSTFVKGRKVDDNANIMLRFKGGGRGMIWASQVAPGNENGLKLRVYGTKAGLEWTQEDPNYLWFTPFGEPKRLITRGGAGSDPAAARVTRVPPGHPGRLSRRFRQPSTPKSRAPSAPHATAQDGSRGNVPGVEDGVAGMAFIEAASNRRAMAAG